MEYIWYVFVSLILLAVLIVVFRQKRLYKDFTQECKNSREQRHTVEKNFRDVQSENEKSIASLRKQLTDLQAEYAKHCEQSAQEQKQTHQTIRELETLIHQLTTSLEETQKNYRELKSQLEFFTKIESDSTELNADTPSKQVSVTATTPQEESAPGLDEEQKAAYDLVMNTEENVFITGKAGTGKSYLLRTLVNDITKKTVVLAPTGIAALNVQGATLHSTFGYGNLVDLDIDQITADTIRLKSEKKKLLSKVETIIIDEISMVRSDVFSKIDRILQVLNNSEKPFGGKQMVIFGDLFQLPPIAKKTEWRFLIDRFGGRHFFHSPAYEAAGFHLFELTINHRQKDDVAFFELLNRVREGSANRDDIAILNDRADADITAERRITKLFSHKADAERVNSEELAKIPAKEYVFPCEILYSKNDLTQNAIDDLFPITANLRLKLGALIMMVTNDRNQRWVNGTLGVISSINENEIKVRIDGYEYEIHREGFKQSEAIYENGRISYQITCEVVQFPVILAYAITIHKSQGMTYKKIGCDINKCFEPGQAYVALSRCTNLDGLYLLDRVRPDRLQVDGEVAEFYKSNFH